VVFKSVYGKSQLKTKVGIKKGRYEMDTETIERLIRLETEMKTLHRSLRIWRTVAIVSIGLVSILLAGAIQSKQDDYIRAKSLAIVNDSGQVVVQAYGHKGGGSVLIRDVDGREAIHLISGKERNDLFIYDNHANLAVALQGMSNQGRFGVYRTMNKDKAKDYKVSLGAKGNKRTVPLIRFPEDLPLREK